MCFWVVPPAIMRSPHMLWRASDSTFWPRLRNRDVNPRRNQRADAIDSRPQLPGRFATAIRHAP
jgi:hypothetical protein